jgi:adenosylhomocysteine nucleosidase
MPEKIAIVAALPREIAALVRGTKADAGMRGRGVWLYRVKGAVVVAAGMGAKRAAVAVEAALATGEVGMLISTGLAGGCMAGVEAGSVMEAGTVVDAATGERFATATAGAVTLASAGTIASVREKAGLAEKFGAMLVDMEAASVARLARAHGLGFRAIKGVSDGHDFELSALAKFAGERGSFRTGAFALHTAMRPWTWGKAIELGRGSAKALAGLEVALQGVLAQR